MGRNRFCNAWTMCKLSAAALTLSCISACSTNIYLADGSKAAQPGAAASGIEGGSGGGESSIASVPSSEAQIPSATPQRSTGTYIDGQSQMRAPTGRLPDIGGSAQPSANDGQDSPLLSKRHYPIPNYADPSSDAGVLPYTPHDVTGSPGYFTATTIPAPSGLVVVLGAMMRRTRKRAS